MSDDHLQQRRRFLKQSLWLEGGLIAIALLGGRAWGVEPLAHLHWSGFGALCGVVAAVGMLGLVELLNRHCPWLMARVQRLLVRYLGPSLSACRWYELLMVAALVGFAEELAFRGTLQVGLEQSGSWEPLVVSNVIFGLLHAVTVTYAFLAGGMGLLMGWLFDATGERNLLVPMVTHAVYDFFAFQLIVRDYRAAERRRHESPSPDASTPDAEPFASSDIGPL